MGMLAQVWVNLWVNLQVTQVTQVTLGYSVHKSHRLLHNMTMN